MVEAKLLRKKLKNGLIVDKWDLVTIIEKQQAEIDSLQKNLDVALMIVNKSELTDKEIAKYVKEWELKELKENSASTNYVQELAFIDGLTWLLRKAQEK